MGLNHPEKKIAMHGSSWAELHCVCLRSLIPEKVLLEDRNSHRIFHFPGHTRRGVLSWAGLGWAGLRLLTEVSLHASASVELGWTVQESLNPGVENGAI